MHHASTGIQYIWTKYPILCRHPNEPDLHVALAQSMQRHFTLLMRQFPSGVISEYVNSYIPTHTPEEH